ncbi:uncharacterized protein LOC124358233 [Homalodisca vitripennis]|uniref:uncharacterized protein LOC124358233 n=1 Tax=Homalodisca vitripennis TaxID=197043 RepID=UPI001EEB8A39|nr:uncharacterized protein LOC124358233 [Homalodisca vitripennis]
MVTHLSRLMANVGGPKSSKRRLLMSTVQSRQAALRVCSAYRTVSAVLAIAGVIPIKLLSGERKAIYQRQGEIGKDTARTEERSRTYQQWQNSWQQDARGRWTARLIKQIQPWVERRHGEFQQALKEEWEYIEQQVITAKMDSRSRSLQAFSQRRLVSDRYRH